MYLKNLNTIQIPIYKKEKIRFKNLNHLNQVLHTGQSFTENFVATDNEGTAHQSKSEGAEKGMTKKFLRPRP